MSDDHLLMCCCCRAACQHIVEEKDAEIELLRGYRDAAEADAAVARLLLDKSRLTETEMDAMQTAIDTLHAVQDHTKDPCAKTAIAAARIMRLRDRLKPIRNVDSDRSQPIDDEITRLRGQLAWTERERDSLRHAIDNLRQMVVAPAETNPTPMRNGTPAEGSVPGEGSVPDSRNWKEAVAWAVLLADGERIYDVYDFEEEAKAIDEAVTGNHGVVPLYRQPQPTFTPEERIALRDAISFYINEWGDTEDPVVNDSPIIRTLRKLFERTK